jgi:hypothetical protein
MLPPNLGELKALIEKKAIVLRTTKENSLLAELQEIDAALDLAKREAPSTTKSIEKRGSFDPRVLGSAPGRCPICGR